MSRKNAGGNVPQTNKDQALSFTAEEEHVIQPLFSFILSASYEEKRELVAAHPELLTPVADAVMTRIVEIKRKAGAEQDANGIETWREFLADVRSRNFDYALARSCIYKVFVELPDSPAEWNYYLRNVALREEVLRCKEGDIALEEFAKKMGADGLSAVAAAFQGLRSLLKQSEKR
jgi:hypothetical protein